MRFLCRFRIYVVLYNLDKVFKRYSIKYRGHLFFPCTVLINYILIKKENRLPKLKSSIYNLIQIKKLLNFEFFIF
jgi:hypothetical protein